MSTVVLKAEIDNHLTNVLLDSGAGVSIIDSESLKRLNITKQITPTSANLIDASGNQMNILGKVTLSILIKGIYCTKSQEFHVIKTSRAANILLGRDFMEKFGSMTLDFQHNRVKLGKTWLSGLKINKPQKVRVAETTLVPSRTETVVIARCPPSAAFLAGDFEPNKQIGALQGIYSARARSVPDSDGVFKVLVMNVTQKDIQLNSRQAIGFLNPIGTDVNAVEHSINFSAPVIDSGDSPTVNISKDLSTDEQRTVKELLQEYRDIFALNPKRPEKNRLIVHRINTEDSLPVYQKTRRIPTAWEKEVDSQVKEMLANDIIRPSESPWNSPIILVKKKDNSMRFVCDFRKLNDVTKKDTYPLPHIKDVLDKMSGSIYWSTLDAASAYWSMPLSEQDREKTAFSVPRGKFEFNVTPYGLCNAGASYQRLMDMCLSGLPADRVLAYMDDIVIFTPDFDTHLHQLKTVFTRLRSAGITLKASKCVIAHQKVDFLGYELSANGIQPQQRLTDAIRDFPCPSSKKELKRFLGLAGFYRQFIQNFAEISKPLNRLTNDTVVYAWDQTCQDAFDTLKDKLCAKPVLAFPRCGETFIVEVDASNIAVGGVLSQDQPDGTIHPVAYFSTTLNKSQQNWSAHSKEAYALLVAVRTWHVYLAGTSFVLQSDHNPLVHIRSMKDPRGKFARWISELEEYDYSVCYKPGKQNTKADALSRASTIGDDLTAFETIFDDKVYNIDTDGKSFFDQLVQEQNNDPVIGPAKRLIANESTVTEGRLKRVSNQLRIEDDVLTKSGRPVLPASLRRLVVSKFHEIGHFGTEKLHALIKDRFYWPNMFAYLRKFVQSCHICQQTKSDHQTPKAPLLPLFEPDAPMQLVSIDLATLPEDDNGYKYILLIGDVFSKYIEGVPLQNQSAPTVTSAVFNSWILKHGCPSYLLSDQGSNVDGQTIREVCDTFNIEKRRSSAYHSQGNGFAERNIRSVREVFRATLLDRRIPQKQWRSILPEVVFALNTTESSSTKCTPYYVVFGRKPVMLQDLLFNHSATPGDQDAQSAREYAAELKIRLAEVYEHVAMQLNLTRQQMQKQYNKNICFHNYHAGEKVWLRTKYFKTGENKKLSPRRNGPWTVVECLPNGLNFRIQNDSTKNQKVVHHNRITPVKSHETVSPVKEPKEKAQTTPSKASDVETRKRTIEPYLSSSEESASDTENDEPAARRYPLRERRQRVIEGTVPSDTFLQ